MDYLIIKIFSVRIRFVLLDRLDSPPSLEYCYCLLAFQTAVPILVGFLQL